MDGANQGQNEKAQKCDCFKLAGEAKSVGNELGLGREDVRAEPGTAKGYEQDERHKKIYGYLAQSLGFGE